MKPLLLAALLIATPLAAQRVTPRDAEVIPVINGSAVWRGSPECAPRGAGAYVPSPQRTEQIVRAAMTVLQIDLDQRIITTPVPYDVWRMTTSLYWAPQFRDRPTWVMGALPPGYLPNCYNAQGEPRWCGCSAGIGYLSPVIDVSDPARVEPLICWEALNAQFGLLQRTDLWDSATVASLTNRAAALVGGWRTR